jgi:uncharacterized membrane protein
MAVYSKMKTRMQLILAYLTILMFSMTGCVRAATSTSDEPGAAMPEPVVDITPADQTIPNWIYAIIGIGAALAVVVVVYIIRSRRP